MDDADRTRSTREVIDAHLACRETKDLEGDLARNYAPDVLLLSAEGVNRGHDGVRRLAAVLRSYVPEAGYRYEDIVAEGDVALLAWHAEGDQVDVSHGADTFIVRDGRIVVQTIHYVTTRP